MRDRVRGMCGRGVCMAGDMCVGAGMAGGNGGMHGRGVACVVRGHA